MSHDRDGGHAAVVSEWTERCARGLASGPLLEAFETSFRAVWDRAGLTLGEPTITAIVDRVLYTAAEAHPVLAPVRVDATRGLALDALRDRIDAVDPDQLLAAARFVLEEVLRLVGTLTADILTPALHAALSRVAPAGDGEGDP